MGPGGRIPFGTSVSIRIGIKPADGMLRVAALDRNRWQVDSALVVRLFQLTNMLIVGRPPHS
jgi:hypothetical protein